MRDSKGNTGRHNAGYYNVGAHNEGDCNTGSFNHGHYNTGDWNLGNGHTGCFCTGAEETILMFDAPCNWKRIDWEASRARTILAAMDREHPQKWWDDLPEVDKAEIRALPNFNPYIFHKITGIYSL